MKATQKKEYVKPNIAVLSVGADTNGAQKGAATNEGQPGGMLVGMMLTAS